MNDYLMDWKDLEVWQVCG